MKVSIPCLLTSLLLAASDGQAYTVHTDALSLTCLQQDKAGLLQCTYQMSVPAAITGVTATVNNTPLAVEQAAAYPWDGAVTALLILVDTSDPGRQNVIVENRKIIRQILDQAAPHHRLGLASFDKNLRLGAPIGATPAEIVDAADKLQAIGMTTELYRNVLSAITMLEEIPADRKAIYLMSDGLAEDKAYFHQDVIRAARAAGVVINSLGFPRSESQSVGLQTLRRLSNETGGMYVESDSSFQIPEEFMRAPLASIDSGGKFAVNVRNLVETPARDRNIIAINLGTSTGSHLFYIPLESREPVQTAVIQDRTVQATPKTAAPVTIITRDTPVQGGYFWWWYMALVGLICLLVAVITAFFLIVYRQGRRKTGTAMFAAGAAPGLELKPYAYLIQQDETRKRYPITSTTWRIGRGNDNEMVLKDNSISRRHAEIHRDKGDVFTIYDLDSLNGVFVNENKVTKQVLHEGDMLEIGDIILRFTLLSQDYQLEESTLMQNTRTPLSH